MISINIEKKLKAYHGQQVLHIDKQLATGSITKIYGPSGSGKTTFLKVIAGLINPEKGVIKTDGIKPGLMRKYKINLPTQKRNIGFVFQQYALFPNMTVRQHLEYATADENWINRLLLLGKLETLQTHKPDYLSGGQQQRLAILRAIGHQTPVAFNGRTFFGPRHKNENRIDNRIKSLIERTKYNRHYSKPQPA
jgi:molybdate transport system ATP-binding protein